MKSYFAKLLPVKGEIKKDNWFQRPDGVIKQAHEDFEPIKGLTKVKLFLCSRDIPEIGDNIFLENSYNYFSKVIDKVGGSDRDIILEKMPEQRGKGTLDYREMVKVIGEISPDATWIKDGDEFEESDIDHGGWVDEDLKTILIKIKGPCGRFH